MVTNCLFKENIINITPLNMISLLEIIKKYNIHSLVFINCTFTVSDEDTLLINKYLSNKEDRYALNNVVILDRDYYDMEFDTYNNMICNLRYHNSMIRFNRHFDVISKYLDKDL